MEPERRIGVKLSNTAKEKLKSLYKHHRITQSDVIEALIMAASLDTPAIMRISQRDSRKNKLELLSRLKNLSESDLARLLESRIDE